MEKEDLIKLRKHISELSEEEKKKRNLYLRGLANGELQGPQTGYASIDKSWLKYFDEESIKVDFVPMSIYQFMELQNKDNLDGYAINYYGNRIKFKELFKKIDIVANALLSKGIKKGDVVMMSLPNIPEAEYLFYALNKIGAIVCSIDPRTNIEGIKEDIEEFNIKYIFSLDMINDKMTTILNEMPDVNIISVSAFNSLPLPLKIAMELKNKNKNNKSNCVTDWNEFIANNNSKTKVTSVFEPNSVAAIVHTGGSTGAPKGVKLTNENFNALPYQLINSNMQFHRGQKFLNILPPFIALGLDNAMHLAACGGIESIMIPTFEPEDIPGMIKKYKPNLFMGGPIHYSIMCNSKELSNEDLSYLEICVSGGDKMPLELQEKTQEFLKKHNAKANIWIGYGATEASSGLCCVKDDCFRFESIGAPYLKDIFEVYDLDTGEPICGYDKIGELRVTGPTIMVGYTGKHKEEMKDVIKEDDFGNRWYCTGDLAHFDKDGMVYIDGRIKRIITRRGFKIYPAQIEKLIMHHPYIKECAIVGIPDDDELNIPVANIVLNENVPENAKEELITFIDNIISKNFPEYTVMAGYNFLDEMPLTPIGKLDFRSLEQIGIIDNKGKRLQKRFDKK